jgi:membrane AbrB-like protein
MIAAVVAIYSGVRLDVPNWLRGLAFVLLGIQTGGSVTAETVERATQWPLSVCLLGVTVVLVTLACARFFRGRYGWDSSTALFASLPGALSLTLALADEARADMRRVTISQCIRLFFLVAAMPAVIATISPVPKDFGPLHYPDVPHILVLLIASGAAGWVFEKLRVPAGMILGAIAASAALYLSGMVEGATPDVILVPANVVLGVMIGARFQGLPLTEIRRLFGEGFAGFLLALFISSIGAGLAAYFGGLPLALTLLAFAPGGLEAMTIMAFALNLDPAYVAAHQVARYLGIAILMPPIAAWLLSRRGNHAVVTPLPAVPPLKDD